MKKFLLPTFLLSLVVTSATHAAQQDVVPTSVSPDASGVQREAIEWLDVWIPNAADSSLPRVLLLGDSITRAYYPDVVKLLAGKAVVGRLATSKSLGDPLLPAQVSLVLAEKHFDIIHFNNGMHGKAYTEEQYAAAFPALLKAIREGAPNAKLIWASTTPTREAKNTQNVGDFTARIIDRNKRIAALVEAEHIPIDDLFTLVDGHPELWKQDGVHFEAPGVTLEAKQVAAKLLELLK